MPENPVTSAAERLVAALRERILRWELPDGHRLTESGLSEEFGVSRSPVREALRKLAAEGLIEIAHNTGYRVRQPSLNDIEDLYELRLALELMTVEKLTRRVHAEADTSWLDDLGRIPLTDENLALADREFHESLARAAGNDAIVAALSSINDRLVVFRELEAEISGRPEETREQHEAIVAAIASGDTDAASSAMRKNIADALENVEALLGRALVRAQQRFANSSITR